MPIAGRAEVGVRGERGGAPGRPTRPAGSRATWSALIGAYNDILFDKAANDTAAEFVRNKIRDIVNDPEVAETLCPNDHPVGTKRPCLDTDYYDDVQPRRTSRLVDLRKTPITEITPTGIDDDRARLRVRRDRLRHRLRRHDRLARRRRHAGRRRCRR